MIDKNGLKKT